MGAVYNNGMREEYAQDQITTGEWVRQLANTSWRGWNAFYHTARWQAKRKDILRRDRKQCRMCRDKGRYTPATTVHHLKHLREYPELALTDDNLISLCSECHELVHPEKHQSKGFMNEERW